MKAWKLFDSRISEHPLAQVLSWIETAFNTYKGIWAGIFEYSNLVMYVLFWEGLTPPKIMNTSSVGNKKQWYSPDPRWILLYDDAVNRYNLGSLSPLGQLVKLSYKWNVPGALKNVDEEYADAISSRELQFSRSIDSHKAIITALSNWNKPIDWRYARVHGVAAEYHIIGKREEINMVKNTRDICDKVYDRSEDSALVHKYAHVFGLDCDHYERTAMWLEKNSEDVLKRCKELEAEEEKELSNRP